MHTQTSNTKFEVTDFKMFPSFKKKKKKKKKKCNKRSICLGYDETVDHSVSFIDTSLRRTFLSADRTIIKIYIYINTQ